MKWHFALSQLVAVAATITSAHAEGRHGRAPASAREADAVLLRSVDAVHEYCQVDVATLCTGRRPNNVPHENPFNGIDMHRSFHSRPAPFLLEPPPSLFATPGNVDMGSPFDDIDAIMDGMFRQAMEFASPFLETTRSGHRMGEPVTKITVVRLGDDDAPRPMPLPVPMVTVRPIMPGGDRGPADEVVEEDPDAAIDRIFDNVIFSFLEDVQRTGLGGFGPVMGDVKREKHEDTVPEEAAMPERNDAQITRDEIFGLDDDVGTTDEHEERSRLGDGDVVQGEKREEAAVVSAAMPETDAPIPKELTSESEDAGEVSKEEFVPPKKFEGFDDDLYDDFYFVFDDDLSSPSSPSKRDEVGFEDEHERQHRHDHEVDPAHLADALSAAGRELLRSSASASTSRDGMTENVAEEDPLRLRFARRLTEVAPSAPAVLRHREPRLHEDVVAPVAQMRSPGGPIPVPPRFPDLRYGCPRVERCLWERRHSPPSPFSAPLSTKCANALDVVREADVNAREAHAREESAASTTATTLRLVLRPPAVDGGEGRTTWTQLSKDLVANADPCGLHLAALGFFTSLLCVVLLCGCFGSDPEDEEEEDEDDGDYGEGGDDQVHHGYPGAAAMARRNEAIRREMALRNVGVAPMASETAGGEVFVAVPVVE